MVSEHLRALGWRHTLGIDSCEFCHRTLGEFEEAVARLAEQLDSLEALAHQSDQLQVSESMAQLIPPSDLDDLGPEMEVNLDALAPFASDIEEEDEEDEAPLNLR